MKRIRVGIIGANPDRGWGAQAHIPALKFLTDEKVKAILEHLGLPTTGPPVAPARPNESPEFAIWQDDVPELQQSLR
jgi:hypothetical protein